MKLQTDEEKKAWLFGYIFAEAESLSEKLNIPHKHARDLVKKEIVEWLKEDK